MDEVKWYESCSLDSIKNIIKDNINTASRSFVAIGYYLKNVRDRELYLDDGYQSIWEFAQNEFGISQSWASRYMSINDRFSKDGNSPMIKDEFKDFSSSKLSEMLTLTDKQLEEVTLTTTRAEIRDLKSYAHAHKTEQEKNIASSVQLTEVDQRIKNTIIRSYIDSFPDWKKENIRKAFSESKNLQERIGYIESCTVFGQTKIFLENEEKCLYLRKYGEDELELSDWYHDFAEFAPGVSNFIFTYGDVAGIADGILYEMNPKSSGKCIHRSEFACTLPEAAKLATLNGENCSSSCCWNCEKHSGCGYECNSSAHRHIVNEQSEVVIGTSEIVINELESVIPEKECGNCNYDNMDPDKYREDHPGTKEFPCNNSDDKLNHWMPKIEGFNHPVDESEEVETVEADIIKTIPQEDEDQEAIDPEHYTCQDIRDELDKLIEDVGIYRKNNDTAPGRRKAKMRLDAMVLLDEEMRKLKEKNQPDNEPMVKKMARFAMEWFEQGDYSSADFYLFQARKDLADNYEYDRDFYPDYINDNRKPQPALPILKNNDQRKEWIDNYQSWPVWIDLPQTGEKFYRYDLSHKVSIVVKVSKKHGWEHYKETKEIEYGAEQYYLLGVRSEWSSSSKGTTYKEDDSRTFYEFNTNKSALVDYLRAFQKKG